MGVLFKLRRILKLRRGQEGSAAVEFALCLLPLLLIVGGILDYGHFWYMQSVLATASREGARYATHYQSPKVNPNSLSPSIEDFVLNTPAENGGNLGVGLTDLLFADADPAVIPGGPGYTSGTGSLSVQATAKKYWFILSYLIPGLTNPQLLSATTYGNTLGTVATLKNSKTYSGSAGVNVLDITTINLNNNQSVTLSAPKGASFVVRVSDSITVGNSCQFLLSGGITSDGVTFVYKGTTTVNWGNSGIVYGSLLSPNAAICPRNGTSINGGVVISSKNISLNNNNITTARTPWLTGDGASQGAALVQ